MTACNARWRLRVPAHGRGASRCGAGGGGSAGEAARAAVPAQLRAHAPAAGGTERVYVVQRGPCSLAYVGQQSHTRYYSCVTNACIRPTAAATAACTCTQRDGKCSQCTNLRSLLERPPAILLCTRVCACVRASVPGSKPRKLAISAKLFRGSRFTPILVVFASLNATLS